MKRKLMALMVCASTQSLAVELVVSAHQADPGFKYRIHGVFWRFWNQRSVQ